MTDKTDKEILAFAELIVTTPAYTAEQMGCKLVSHGDQKPSHDVMLIGGNWREIIVKALRFYANQQPDIK